MRLPLRRLIGIGIAGICATLIACTSGTEPLSLTDSAVAPDAPASLTLFTSAPSVSLGQVLEVGAVVRNASGVALPGALVEYTTSNGAVVTPATAHELNAVGVGSAFIVARAGSLTATAAVSVGAANTPVPASWSFCVNEGNMCQYDGLRVVRLGPAGGPYVQQVSYHTVPCAVFGFQGQNPAPGMPLHCDIGPQLTAVLNNAAPGMGLNGATVTVPLGAVGATVQRVRPTSDVPVVTDGSGSFRTTCQLAAFEFNDPIVYPGVPGASHLHVFFGNSAVRASSNSDLIASTGASTCRGGIINRTAYWAPAVIDGTTGEVQTPDDGIFYYKSGYNMAPQSIQPFPAGLRMIAGDKTATGAQPNVEWGCRDHYTGPSASIPTNCPAGDYIRLVIQFPQCWDGKNLDSPDHKSHMAFPVYRNAPQQSSCPATHPVPLPAITEKFDYPVTGRTPAAWRLSSDMYSPSLPGGLSAHADWMGGWDPVFMQKIVTQCIAKAVDCGVASIGDGTELY